MAGSYLRRDNHRRDHVRRHVEYATVKGVLANFTDAAILVSTEQLTVPAWVPRHSLEPACRAMLFHKVRGDQIEVQVELKMALEKKLV